MKIMTGDRDMKKEIRDMKVNRLVELCVMATLVAVMLTVCPVKGYGQEPSIPSSATDPANQLVNYYDAAKGYKIRGTAVLTENRDSQGHGILALGFGALIKNAKTGFNNTALGNLALANNTMGVANTASGAEALYSNTAAGSFNTASGFQALYANTTGKSNTASGVSALLNNSTGINNTASGNGALVNNNTGNNNAAFGYLACNNVATGSNVTCIGAASGPSGDVTGPATYIANVYGAATTGSGNPLVCVDSTGLLGTVNCATSDAQEVIQRLQKQNEEFQQRLSRLEALIANERR
ncbi:MAG TPA: hypothetical protein VN777_02670 [Terriglobales bacterium]|nr:hypothetical protein [Terriglobales bacterium]